MHKNNPIRLYIIAATAILIFSAAASYAVARLRQPDYVREYSDIQIIDIHNHDASHYFKSLFVWRKFSIEQIVLFGDISSSDAQKTDKMAWKAYYKHPGLFYPFIAGVDTYNEGCLTYVKQNLELGCYGVGEIVTASQLSPMAADQEWKAENPLDGYLPELYELCAEYNAPLLVHIDPPSQRNIYIFEKSLSLYPDTLFILAHGNVYNSCDLLMELLANHDNLYIDLVVGFSENPECTETLDDYVRMNNSYPDRIMVSRYRKNCARKLRGYSQPTDDN